VEHSRVYKFLIVIVIVSIGLIGMFYLDSLTEVSSLGQNMITGMAFSESYDILPGVPLSGGAAIDPKAGTVVIDSMDTDTFNVGLVVNPNGGLTYKYFKISFVYIPFHLELIQVGGMVGFKLSELVIEEFGFFNKITVEGFAEKIIINYDRKGNPIYKETSFTDGELDLLKIQFKPVVATPKVSETEVMINSVSVKESESAPDNNAINQNSLEKGKIFFKYKCYNDNDKDGYGFGKIKTVDGYGFCVNGNCCTFDSGDCDDSITNDPPECPETVSGCYFGKSGNFIYDKYKNCAICINPSMFDPCDDVDNNCDNIIDGAVFEGDACQEPVEGDCPLEECSNGLDEDGDNAIDEKDKDCRGHPGNCDQGEVIVWSYRPDDELTLAPGLIGCCNANQCVDTVCTTGYTFLTGEKICNNVLGVPPPPSFTLNCFYEGETSTDEPKYICGRHNHWIKCDESYVGKASDNGEFICKNIDGVYSWEPLANYLGMGNSNVNCPECSSEEFVVPNSLTPACGIDGDDDDDLCDPMETFLTCPEDCDYDKYCSFNSGCEKGYLKHDGVTCERYADTDGDEVLTDDDYNCLYNYVKYGSDSVEYEMISDAYGCNIPDDKYADLNCDGVLSCEGNSINVNDCWVYGHAIDMSDGTIDNDAIDANDNDVLDVCDGDSLNLNCDMDTDNDGLPDEYEVYLNGVALQKGLIQMGGAIDLNALSQENALFYPNSEDTDGDGINDGNDYCPNTDTSNPLINTGLGRINALGCYAADTANELTGQERPDGCFTVKDAGLYGDYYTNVLTESCTNLYGEIVES
jgi:hypothetical protein